MARPKRATKDQADTGAETKGSRTRTLIMNTIVELLAEKGQRFVLEEVCVRTGLTVGAFYFHFKSKEEAIEEIVIERLHRSHRDALEAVADAGLYENIFAIIWLRLTGQEEDKVLFHLPYRVIPTSFRVYKEWLAVRDAVVEKVAHAVAREKRGPQARATNPDHLASHFLMAGLEGFMENAFYGSHAQVAKFDLRPIPLSRDLAAIWYSAVMGQEVDPSVVKATVEAFQNGARRLAQSKTKTSGARNIM